MNASAYPSDGKRDGLSPERGLGSINEGIKLAQTSGCTQVVVCDAGVYAENVVMGDGIALIGRADLPEGYGPPDVLTWAEEQKLPTISPLPRPEGRVTESAVLFPRLANKTLLQGFLIRGAVARRGAGIMIDTCDNVELVAVCLKDNHALEAGGGIAVRNTRRFSETNLAIVDCSSDGDGGGVWQKGVSQSYSCGGLSRGCSARGSGGGEYTSGKRDPE